MQGSPRRSTKATALRSSARHGGAALPAPV